MQFSWSALLGSISPPRQSKPSPARRHRYAHPRVEALEDRLAPATFFVTTTKDAAKPISYKHIEMDPARRRARVGNTDVDLTANEFHLLYVILSSPGIVFSREALLSRVWKDQTFVTVRSVDTLIKRLRKKIESNPAEPEVILTVWGTGYKAADV